jgi:hypothetical protein
MKTFYHSSSKKAIVENKIVKIKKITLKTPIFASKMNNI